jgi:hypoxanthine phosphoribosyltransferase
MLHSLASRIKEQYRTGLPSLLGFGVSGAELADRFLRVLEDENVQSFHCNVSRKGGKIENVFDFPSKEKMGEKLLICDTIVDTGKTMEAVTRHAWKNGIKDVKTLSIAVRNGSEMIPNFYALMVDKHDYIYFPTLNEYPTTTLPRGLLRRVKQDDLNKKLKFGKLELDQVPLSHYIDFSSKGYLTYLIEDDETICAILHFYPCEEDVEVEILAVSEFMKNRGYGPILVHFLVNWCRFNGKQYIRFPTQQESVNFYVKNGFEKIDEKAVRLKVY